MSEVEISLSQEDWDEVDESIGSIRSFNCHDGELNPLYSHILEEVHEDLAEWVEQIDIEVDDE